MQAPKRKPLPAHIKQYAFDFHWDNQKVWQLDVSIQSMSVTELTWHFDIPWLHSENGRFDVTPTQVMDQPEKFAKEYARTMSADLNYSIDIMRNKGRWLILDGLHRLMKSVMAGKTHVTVRVLTEDQIPDIAVS